MLQHCLKFYMFVVVYNTNASVLFLISVIMVHCITCRCMCDTSGSVVIIFVISVIFVYFFSIVLSCQSKLSATGCTISFIFKCMFLQCNLNLIQFLGVYFCFRMCCFQSLCL